MLVDTNSIYTVTDLRKNTAEILERVAKSKKPAAILTQGKLKAVLVDVGLLDKLQEYLEYVQDTADAKRALKSFKKSVYVDLDKFWKDNNLSE